MSLSGRRLCYVGLHGVLALSLFFVVTRGTKVIADGNGELDELAGDELDAELGHLLARQRPGERTTTGDQARGRASQSIYLNTARRPGRSSPPCRYYGRALGDSDVSALLASQRRCAEGVIRGN